MDKVSWEMKMGDGKRVAVNVQQRKVTVSIQRVA
jgi:hypothetical protein